MLPPCTVSASFPIVLRRTGSGSCFPSTLSPRNSGRPESISVASWRVKIIKTFGLIVFRSRKGMLISFFFPPLLAFDAFAALGAAAFALEASITLVG